MAVPWNDLDLTAYLAESGRKQAWFVGGEAVAEPSAATSSRRPTVFFEEASDPVRESEHRFPLRLMARSLLPTLPHHELGPVCEHYGIHVNRGREATAVGELFAALVREALSLDRELIELLSRLFPQPLSGLLERMLLCPVEAVDARVASGDAAEETSAAEPEGSVDAVLGESGYVARTHEGYGLRAGQVEMAHRVEDAFRFGGSLAVEAGPGTGKTFAYLVPSILHLRARPDSRVVVSTRTKQLQEQLFRKDLPFLVSGLAPKLAVALLKGRENYLCLRRWDALIAELEESLERDRLWTLAPLGRWLYETETGDIEENAAFFSDPAGRELWYRLCDTAHHCVEAFCVHSEACFSIRARRRARRADLVVVNHALLLADRAADGVVLGKYSHLVIDEAHALEDTARSAFTSTFSVRVIERLGDTIAPVRGKRTGWLARIPAGTGHDDASRVGEMTSQLRGEAAGLFQALEQHLPQGRRDVMPPTVPVAEKFEAVSSALGRLEAAITDVLDRIEEPEAKREGEVHALTIAGLFRLSRVLAEAPEANVVHWFERERGGLELHVTPLDVASILAESLYPPLEAVVLTSATLSLGGDFGFLCRSVGLDKAFDETKTYVVDSPFSYAERMRIYVPAFMPAVEADAGTYADALSDLLAALIDGTQRKGLVLFTSYQLLHDVRCRLPRHVYVLAQGIDGPRSKLIERFRRRRGAALLLGTDSFWEGVDLPGDALEILVITRLPFSVPTDPIQRSLADLYAGRGLSPFIDLSLPQAILKLRQGVGRLIRTQTDRGIVVLTDTRVLSRSYGARIAASLPVTPDVYRDEDGMVQDARGWFDHPVPHRCGDAGTRGAD